MTAREVTSSWSQSGAGSITWNNQPSVDTTSNPLDSVGGTTGGWWTFGVGGLFQRYNDNVNNTNDFGIRLDAPDNKTFSSSESTDSPYVAISYNDLPNPPNLTAPNNGNTLDNNTPTLKINSIPSDPNGDDVMVQYQVTANQNDWTSSLVKTSDWTTEESFTLPSSWLAGGDGQYWWRVIARDVCNPPDGLCDLQDASGTRHAPPTSNVWSFTVNRKRYGTDPSWDMWSQGLGNSMGLNVNPSNGNVYLDVPLDSLPTPLGHLNIGLSYNSQAAAAGDQTNGMGAGWTLHAGPSSSGQQLPVSIETLTPAPYMGVKITYRSGKTETYPWRAGKSYGNIGAGSGVVTGNANGGYTYRGPNGDEYTFDSNGDLATARPVSSKPKSALAQNPYYSYNFDTSTGHLLQVSDPMGRNVNFTWNGGNLTDISAWTGDAWHLTYLNESINTIQLPSTQLVSGGAKKNPTLTFNSSHHCNSTSGPRLIDDIRDGQQTDGGNPGWTVNYAQSGTSGGNYDLCRATNVYPPQLTPTQNYQFDYGARGNGYAGYTSLSTDITDPRGTATGTTGDYLTKYDFTYGGLPIQTVEAKVNPTTEQSWVTQQAWDSNGQMLCQVDPVGYSLGGRCNNNNLSDPLATVNNYDNNSPYALLTSKTPQFSSTAGTDRIETQYAYEVGSNWNGLWGEEFTNQNLAGVPVNERLYQSLNQDWGNHSPPAINQDDSWSLRLSGNLDIQQNSGTKYEFNVIADDGVTFSIGNKVLLDCFGQTTPGTNCGQNNPPSMTLYPGPHPITVEYQEKQGTANLHLQYRRVGQSQWSEFDQSMLSPNMNLLTTQTTGPTINPSGGGSFPNNPLTTKTQFSYPTDDSKMLHLPASQTVTNLDDNTSHQTSWLYDDYGRKTRITRFDSTGDSQVTHRTFTDNVNQKTSCMTQKVGPTGAETDFTCDKSGNVTSTTQVIRAVGAQPAQNRSTTTTFDAAGRPLEIDHPGGGIDQYGYDRAGRTVSQRQFMGGSVSNDADWAKTVFTFNDYSFPSAFPNTPSVTTDAPDPAGSGNATGPETIAATDWAGNAIGATDARTGKTWWTGYDAQNRVVCSEVVPGTGSSCGTGGDLTSTTTYTLGNPNNLDDRTGMVTDVQDPAGVITETGTDIGGRTTYTQTGTAHPSWDFYDTAANVAEIKQAATRDTTDANAETWVKNAYNGWGQVVTKTQPWISSGTEQDVSTSYSYFPNTGYLQSVNGPVTGSSHKDQMDYTYDDAGNILTSTMWTSPTTSYTTSQTFDDAGERVSISTNLTPDQQNTNTQTQVRDWAYTVDGQMTTYTEHHGSIGTLGNQTTTTNYDAAGRISSIADPRGINLCFATDDLGRETDRWSPSGACTATPPNPLPTHSIHTTYYADGNVNTKTRTLTSGTNSISYTYDNAGRTTGVSDGTNSTTFGFDSGTGQLTSTATTAGTTQMTYYGAGQSGGSPGELKTIVDPLSTGTTTYTYDAVGRVTGRTDPANETIARTYESQTGNVDTQTVTQPLGGQTKTLAYFDLGYDQAGNVNSRTERLWASGYVGNPSTATTSDTGTGTWTYNYDDQARMLFASGPNASGNAKTWNYTYDGAGDRLTASNLNGTKTATYTNDLQGLPDHSVQNSVTTTYSYDNADNLTGIDVAGTTTGDQSFTYDPWGGTLTGSLSGNTVSYTLDPLERTVSRTAGATTDALTYVGDSQTLAKDVSTTGGTPTTTKYAWALGEPLDSKTGSGAASFSVCDLHSDVVGQVASGAGLSNSTWYSPYGESAPLGGSAASGLTLGYQGDVTDATTSQVDMTTRMYMPSLGRFSSEDVLFGDPSNPSSLNQFVYSQGSPLTFVDTTGMCTHRIGQGCDPGNGHSPQTEITCPGGQLEPHYSDCPPPDAGTGTSGADGVTHFPCWDGSTALSWGGCPPVPPRTVQPASCWGWHMFGCAVHAVAATADRVWWGARFAVNLPYTAVGVGWSYANGGSCRFEAQLQLGCYGLNSYADGPRGGFTMGNVFMTQRSRDQVAQDAILQGTTIDDLLAHERKHSDQWAIFGGSFPVLYAIDDVMAGNNPCHQLFEKWAGLKAGGYSQC